jgi:hypothetical protein
MADWSINSYNMSTLIYEWLHGNPSAGSPPGVHHGLEADFERFAGRWPWAPREIGPGPHPWEPNEVMAAASLLSAISLRTAASRMADSPQKSSLENTGDSRLAELTDDCCGTPPGSPWPGPSLFGYRLAAGLSFLAGTLPEGSLRAAIEEVSTHMLERLVSDPISGTEGGPPTGGARRGRERDA